MKVYAIYYESGKDTAIGIIIGDDDMVIAANAALTSQTGKNMRANGYHFKNIILLSEVSENQVQIVGYF